MVDFWCRSFSRFTQSFSRFIRDVNGEKKHLVIWWSFSRLVFHGLPPLERRRRARKRLSNKCFWRVCFFSVPLKFLGVLRADLKGTEKKRTLQKHLLDNRFRARRLLLEPRMTGRRSHWMERGDDNIFLRLAIVVRLLLVPSLSANGLIVMGPSCVNSLYPSPESLGRNWPT